MRMTFGKFCRENYTDLFIKMPKIKPPDELKEVVSVIGQKSEKTMFEEDNEYF